MSKTQGFHPVHVAFLAWLVPGLGYVILGERAKGRLFGALIIGAFLAGLILGSFQDVFIGPGRYAVFAQAPAGIVALASLGVSYVRGAHEVPTDVNLRLFDIGTLYTTVAGLLNALLVFDVIVKSYEKLRGVKVER